MPTLEEIKNNKILWKHFVLSNDKRIEKGNLSSKMWDEIMENADYFTTAFTHIEIQVTLNNMPQRNLRLFRFENANKKKTHADKKLMLEFIKQFDIKEMISSGVYGQNRNFNNTYIKNIEEIKKIIEQSGDE